MTLIYIIASVTIIKFLQHLYKRDSPSKEVIDQPPVDDNTNRFTSVREKYIAKSFDSAKDEPDLSDPLVRPEISKNNKWLHPTNEIGKMEEGVVDYEPKEQPKKKKIVLHLPEIEPE